MLCPGCTAGQQIWPAVRAGSRSHFCRIPCIAGFLGSGAHGKITGDAAKSLHRAAYRHTYLVQGSTVIQKAVPLG